MTPVAELTALAGLRDGDIIVELAGRAISGVDDLHRVLSDEASARNVEMRALRGQSLEHFSVHLIADSRERVATG
jgi:S1-C subfamily serine protease